MHRRELLKAIPAFGLAGCMTDQTSAPRSTETTADGRTTNSATPSTPDPVSIEPGQAVTFAVPGVWEALEGSASVVEECTDGTCLRLDRGSERSRIARRFDRPRDCTGVRPAATMRASQNTYPRIQLFDENGNELRFRAPVRGGLALQSFNFGIETVEGEPDLSRIAEIRFNQDGSPTMWLDRLTFHEPLPPTVLVMLDDKFIANHSDGIRLLDEHGFPATVFVDVGSMGGDDNLTVSQLSALQRAGWDVCNHTIDHDDLRKLDVDSKRHQIVGGQRWLVRRGFDAGADYFSYPYSQYDQSALDIVEQTHRLAFAGGYPAAGAIPNHLLVPRRAVDGVEHARQLIDLTARFGGVTGLFYHSIEENDERALRQTAGYLNQRMSDGDVEVATASDLAQLLDA